MQINQRYAATVKGIKLSVWLEGDETKIQVRYARYTRMGRILLSNAGGERAILANYIRQELRLPRGEANATIFEFVGV